MNNVLYRKASLRAVLHRQGTINDAFWSPRLQTNRTVTIPFALQQCEQTGRIDNFRKAGRLLPGEFVGLYYDDSDVYKVLEGAAHSLADHPDPKLDEYLDQVIVAIAAAQEPDGYLYTNRTINPNQTQKAAGPERWCNLKDSHELYNVGHLYEAAVAHFIATGKRTLLEVAIKNAELILKTFGPEARCDPPGHQEIEIGLIKLYGVTGDRRYLQQARFFLDQRGHYLNGRPNYGTYAQDHQPVAEQSRVVGHAVRALYMYSAMADVAALTGDSAYLAAVDKLWHNLVDAKLALTGGAGARKSGEAFGEPYELPNATSYNETCAAIANIFWNHRLFLLTGDGKYLDVLERSLYNGMLAGVSLTGDRFFYVNPLSSDGVTPFNYGGEVTRAPWFKCSCCPVNVARLLASLGGYIYAVDEGSLWVNLYISSEFNLDIPGAGPVRITQQSAYPWSGRVSLQIDPKRAGMNFALRVRIAGWARGKPVPGDLYRYLEIKPQTLGDVISLSINGAVQSLPIENGFVSIRRTWHPGDRVEFELPMPVQRVLAHPAVAEDAGRVAIERGPLVYCAEAVDNDQPIDQISVPDALEFRPRHDPRLLNGVTLLRDGNPVTLIPYYAWNHRGPGAMAVWFKRALVPSSGTPGEG